ncbi:hypothetical protein FF38_06189 [Lucilia cuprina]|uniref:Uncharacterized protein n=1 Tax=Lucilia cuprina TaxID=7375 RepID=A0A0L0C6A7_LUCCU|nr:hypothetical protein FF38_06189 [Lucilia cuprina]
MDVCGVLQWPQFYVSTLDYLNQFVFAVFCDLLPRKCSSLSFNDEICKLAKEFCIICIKLFCAWDSKLFSLVFAEFCCKYFSSMSCILLNSISSSSSSSSSSLISSELTFVSSSSSDLFIWLLLSLYIDVNFLGAGVGGSSSKCIEGVFISTNVCPTITSSSSSDEEANGMASVLCRNFFYRKFYV